MDNSDDRPSNKQNRIHEKINYKTSDGRMVEIIIQEVQPSHVRVELTVNGKRFIICSDNENILGNVSETDSNTT